MPVAKTATTTPKEKEKTYTKAQIEKACDTVRGSILEDMKESSFFDAMDLACKLFSKRLKEELK